MVKDDGKTHVVLRWGDYPGDLDMYLLPLGVRAVDDDQTPVDWFAMTCTGSTFNQTCGLLQCGQRCGDWVEGHDNGDPLPWYPEFETTSRPPGVQTPFGGLAREQAYAFYMQKQIKGVAPDVEFVEGQTLYPLLTQDRDDYGHAAPGFDNLDPWPNGPEGMTLENLLPGTYEVYITAWDNGAVTELLQHGLMLDIYLGNGKDKMVKADTVMPTSDISGKSTHFQSLLSCAICFIFPAIACPWLACMMPVILNPYTRMPLTAACHRGQVAVRREIRSHER